MALTPCPLRQKNPIVPFYYDHTGHPPGITKGAVQCAISRAEAAWSAQTGVTLIHRPFAKTCINRIEWDTNLEGKGTMYAGTCTFFYVEKIIDQFTIKLNRDGFDKNTTTFDIDDIPTFLNSTIMHELGHALGLHHSTNEMSVMHARNAYQQWPIGADLNALRKAYQHTVKS